MISTRLLCYVCIALFFCAAVVQSALSVRPTLTPAPLPPQPLTVDAQAVVSNNGDLSPFLGMHFIFKTNTASTRYEMYIKNATHIDYRAFRNSVAGQWVSDQRAVLTPLNDDALSISWESAARGVESHIFMPNKRIYFRESLQAKQPAVPVVSTQAFESQTVIISGVGAYRARTNTEWIGEVGSVAPTIKPDQLTPQTEVISTVGSVAPTIKPDQFTPQTEIISTVGEFAPQTETISGVGDFVSQTVIISGVGGLRFSYGWSVGIVRFLENVGVNSRALLDSQPAAAGYENRINGQPPTQYPNTAIGAFAGLRVRYTYKSGTSSAELYLKNETSMDYFIQHGMGARAVSVCLLNVTVALARLGDDMVRITMPGRDGSFLSSVLQIKSGRLNGVSFFPKRLLDPDDSLSSLFVHSEQEAVIDSSENVGVDQHNVIKRCQIQTNSPLN